MQIQRLGRGVVAPNLLVTTFCSHSLPAQGMIQAKLLTPKPSITDSFHLCVVEDSHRTFFWQMADVHSKDATVNVLPDKIKLVMTVHRQYFQCGSSLV